MTATMGVLTGCVRQQGFARALNMTSGYLVLLSTNFACADRQYASVEPSDDVGIHHRRETELTPYHLKGLSQNPTEHGLNVRFFAH